MKRLIALFGVILCFSIALMGKTVEIRLTGTLHENVKVSMGISGRSEIISCLPFIFFVDSKDLPMRLHFESPSFLYYDIDVPRKPYDTTGHVYLVKIDEMAMERRSSNPNKSSDQISDFNANNDMYSSSGMTYSNVSRGVDVAPATKYKNEHTFALIMCNEEYEMAANVENAINDGRAFKDYCINTLGVPELNVNYGANLSYGKMRKAISDALDLASVLKGKATLILYYAGHGIPDNKTKDAYLLPVDADGTDTQVCISLAELYDKINKADINLCVTFIDACFSGAQRGGDMIVAARGVRQKPKDIKPIEKAVVFCATSDDEAAYSYKGESHGLFTYFLLSKLQETKGKVSLGDLAEYIRENVALESRRINKAPQTPMVSVSPGLKDRWRDLFLVK